MTDLSPAAQAVDDAFWKIINDKWNIYDRRRSQLAAALRVAAEHLNTTSPWSGHIESTGVNWSRNELCAIADELEGIKYGTWD